MIFTPLPTMPAQDKYDLEYSAPLPCRDTLPCIQWLTICT